MKKEDIPQDDSTLQSANMTEVMYVTDEYDNYTTARSTGWEAKNLALDESMTLINERIEEARKKVEAGTASPIAYFMEKNKMDLGVLSAYVGIWSFFVKRHLKPGGFKKLSEKTLKKYAAAFDITVDELKNFDGKQ
ncbi:hypothetical protein MTP09_13100 [Chryseobacterium suipulveris]|uniref:HTH cro/C1-type domain-containing protein n=1 Tax=Chryseobacterium suipulveris TaxID=2929800 RepID=A0ABY4BSY0_9FLAO|nr:hypothetical protein [Chryseobacterium suipulveris]UOE40826.1 hypothetical protein MTP09_13100 [Chryseobacterium suipulveris]